MRNEPLIFGPQLGPLGNSEAVLLIHYSQPQIIELYYVLQQGVSSYDDMQVPRSQHFMDDISGRFFSGTCQQCNIQPHHVGIGFEPLIMLAGQNLRRGHQASLSPRTDGNQDTNEGNHGFSTAHISLDQPVHLLPGLHIRISFADHPLLGFCQLKR